MSSRDHDTDESERAARLRAEANHDGYVIRRTEHEMAHEARILAQEMERFDADEEIVERQIEDEWRREHWGHEPERPPSWRAGESDPHKEPPQRLR